MLYLIFIVTSRIFLLSLQGYVTRDEFTELLTDTLDAQASEAQSLFDKVDSTNSGKLTYGKSLMLRGRVIFINPVLGLFPHRKKADNFDICV